MATSFRQISRSCMTNGLGNLALALALSIILLAPCQAQTFSVIHNFTGGADGATPYAGVTIDAGGKLYGTTSAGGLANGNCSQQGCGVAFRLTPQGSGWTLTPLYKFHGGNDGRAPMSKPVFGPKGLLYGTTDAGGEQFCEGSGCGTLYSLRPGATSCTTTLCAWSESIVYSFGGIEDICVGIPLIRQPRHPGQPYPPILGSCPVFADLTFDRSGNIYGTVPCCDGSVYRITTGVPTALYYFAGGTDGAAPQSGVIFDSVGNLYGTTAGGGANDSGTVYELSPHGSGWTEKILYSFQGASDGSAPVGGLIMDAAGNLYGTTSLGGDGMGGTVFQLSPSGGSWTFHLLASLSYTGTFDFPFYGPSGSLVMDAQGNLYGTAVLAGAFDLGSVFKLTRSNGGWTYTSLHDFAGQSDQAAPYGSVAFDANGNLYGTVSNNPYGGGCQNGNPCGAVWKITP